MCWCHRHRAVCTPFWGDSRRVAAMVVCIVKGCRNRSGRDKVSFYRIPGGISLPDDQNNIIVRRRTEWLKRMKITDCKMKHARVCAAHFISGKPSDKSDVDNLDWAPSLNLDENPSQETPKPQVIKNDTVKRKDKRSKKRNRKRSSSTIRSHSRKKKPKIAKMLIQTIKQEPPDEYEDNPKECAEIIPSALCEVVISPERRSASRDEDDFVMPSTQLRRESKNYSRSTASNQVLVIARDHANITVPVPDRYSIIPSSQQESNDEIYRLPPTKAPSNEEHPIEIFFKSMARTVMRFPPHLIAEARMMVCSLVSEMEFRAIYEGYPLNDDGAK